MLDSFPHEPDSSEYLTLKQKVLLKVVEAAIKHDGMYKARTDFFYLENIVDEILKVEK